MKTVIEVTNLTKTYGSEVAVKDISFTVTEGEATWEPSRIPGGKPQGINMPVPPDPGQAIVRTSLPT